MSSIRQILLRTVDVENLIDENHSARSVWALPPIGKPLLLELGCREGLGVGSRVSQVKEGFVASLNPEHLLSAAADFLKEACR
jgi:hypothetical protein